MKLIEGGQEPATKDDLRHLQLTMLAGFQLCMEELQILLGVQDEPKSALTKEEIKQLIFEQRAHFDQQMEISCQHILKRQSQAERD